MLLQKQMNSNMTYRLFRPLKIMILVITRFTHLIMDCNLLSGQYNTKEIRRLKMNNSMEDWLQNKSVGILKTLIQSIKSRFLFQVAQTSNQALLNMKNQDHFYTHCILMQKMLFTNTKINLIVYKKTRSKYQETSTLKKVVQSNWDSKSVKKLSFRRSIQVRDAKVTPKQLNGFSKKTLYWSTTDKYTKKRCRQT